MAVLVSANVIARKVFNNSLTVSDEMPNYLFVLMSFMGTAIAARRKAHLGLSSVAAILVQGAGKPVKTIMSVLPRLCSSASSKFVLLAIPFFILSGNVMEKAGYSAPFSCALMAAGGAIGVVIPSSITFVVFGPIAEGASITDLFISGLVPGLLMDGGLIVASLVLGRKMDLKVMPKSSSLERWQALKDAFWGLLMPVIILGGIFHPHRGGGGLRLLRPDSGRVRLPGDQPEKDDRYPHRLLQHHRHRHVHHHGGHSVRLCAHPGPIGPGHRPVHPSGGGQPVCGLRHRRYQN